MPLHDSGVTFARLLQRMRRDRGLTREQLARIAGVSTQTIYRVENNQHNRHHADTIVSLCRALDFNDPLSDDEIAHITATTEIGPDALRHDAFRHARVTQKELVRSRPSADASRLLSLLEGLIDICGSVEDAQERLQFLVAFEAHQRGRETVQLDDTQLDENQLDKSKPLAITRGEQFIDEGLIAETVTIYSKPISPPAPAHKAKSPKKSTTLRAANG